MVRIARREEFTYETSRSSDDHPLIAVRTDRHVIAGVNHDAFDTRNRRSAENHIPLASCRCIADKCAMWRWVPMTESVPTVTLGASGQPARTFGAQTVRTHGYCGLAPLHSVPAS